MGKLFLGALSELAQKICMVTKKIDWSEINSPNGDSEEDIAKGDGWIIYSVVDSSRPTPNGVGTLIISRSGQKVQLILLTPYRIEWSNGVNTIDYDYESPTGETTIIYMRNDLDDRWTILCTFNDLLSLLKDGWDSVSLRNVIKNINTEIANIKELSDSRTENLAESISSLQNETYELVNSTEEGLEALEGRTSHLENGVNTLEQNKFDKSKIIGWSDDFSVDTVYSSFTVNQVIEDVNLIIDQHRELIDDLYSIVEDGPLPQQVDILRQDTDRLRDDIAGVASEVGALGRDKFDKSKIMTYEEGWESQPAVDDEVFSAKLAKYLHLQITNDIQALERRIQALETNTVTEGTNPN